MKNLETNDSGYRMFDVTFSLVNQTANILVTNDFFEAAGIEGHDVEKLTDAELIEFVAKLDKAKIKGLIKMAFYEGRAGDSQDLASVKNSDIILP